MGRQEVLARTRGAAHDDGLAPHRPSDGIVGPDMNGAVVDQEGVCDPAQAFQRVFVFVSDGFVGYVPARQDKGLADRASDEMVQRGVREHEPEVPVTWCD